MTTVRAAILTVSDRSARGERPDASGPALEKIASEQSWQVHSIAIVPDDKAVIQETLIHWCDAGDVDLILTTGGTGFAARDVTPEATLAVIERHAPGLAEAMRMESLKITPHAMLSRSVCGIRKQTLIINLPGSPNAARENLYTVLPVIQHAVELLQESSESENQHQFKQP